LLEIIPTRNAIGDREAAEVGFPFWSKEVYLDIDELDPDGQNSDEVASALETVGMSRSELLQMTAGDRALAIAEALVTYGRGDEGPAGSAKFILGDRRVLWWGSKTPVGWRYLEDEDREFRALLRQHRRDHDG